MNEKKQEDNTVVQPAPMAVRRERTEAGLISGDVDVQIATAKRFPRSIGKSKELAMTLATLDKEVAAACIYAIPRAGKIIEGPSARLAEIMAVSWGNLRVAAKTIGEDDGFTYAEAVGWDLESNVAISYEVKRRITNRNGERFGEDMVMTTANAATSIALRNVVFRVIPRAYVNEVYLAARKAAAGSVKTLKKQRAEILSFFGERDIEEKQVLELLNVVKIDDVTLDHLATLKAIATSIKDGVVSAEKIFKSDAEVDDKKEKKAGDVASEKEKLLLMIRGEFVKRWPGDSAESKDEKKNEIKVVFGCETWGKVSALPNNVLSAGLKLICERGAGIDFFDQGESPASGDDIPF